MFSSFLDAETQTDQTDLAAQEPHEEVLYIIRK